VPRVLIVDFGAIARRGLLGFLDDAGVDVVTASSRDHVTTRLREINADVVLLNLDAAGAGAQAQEIADTFPQLKVIACSSERPTMLVLPPHGAGSYTSPLTSARLREEVGAL
jgi:DNA-binding NarL/FixJ family response regulator